MIGGIRELPSPTWQPIETAPKDGTWILGVSDHVEDWFLVVSWEEASAQEPWSWRTQDGFLYHATALTHWMPLPPAPSALENQKLGLADAHSKNPPEAEHG